MIFLILIASYCILTATAFGAPGIVPPESFVAERWYPTNLPTVMPPWKMPGVDISSFRTARPHQSPGSTLETSSPTPPTNSLPMPPGSQPKLQQPVFVSEPHPPAPSPIEASGVPSSAEINEDLLQNSTLSSNSDELMTIAVTSTSQKSGTVVMKILSPVFEDITQVEKIRDSEEVLRVNIPSEKEIEGSGEVEPELMSTLKATAKSKPSFTTTMTPPITASINSTTRVTTDSSTRITVATTEASVQHETELITKPSISSQFLTTTTNISSFLETSTNIRDEIISNFNNSETESHPIKDCKDILFLLDSSGNVVQQYEKQKKYIETVVKQLEIDQPRRMALITFAGRTRQKIVVPLPEKPNNLKFLEKLKKARFLRGVTATGAAISVTTQYVLQKSKKVQVVVVTDGFSFDDVDRQSEALRAVTGSEVYVTGRYFPVVKNVLVSLGGTEDHVFFDNREQKLIDALQC